jgi:hypothetical protein
MQSVSVLGAYRWISSKKAIEDGQRPVYHMKAKHSQRVDPLSLASLLETDCATSAILVVKA